MPRQTAAGRGGTPKTFSRETIESLNAALEGWSRRDAGIDLAGAIRRLAPAIEAMLARGARCADVAECCARGGMKVSVHTLRRHLRAIRGESAGAPASVTAAPEDPASAPVPASAAASGTPSMAPAATEAEAPTGAPTAPGSIHAADGDRAGESAGSGSMTAPGTAPGEAPVTAEGARAGPADASPGVRAGRAPKRRAAATAAKAAPGRSSVRRAGTAA